MSLESCLQPIERAPHQRPAVALASLPGPVTLVDLIERSGGLEWREAVAVVQQICLYLKANYPQLARTADARPIDRSDVVWGEIPTFCA